MGCLFTAGSDAWDALLQINFCVRLALRTLLHNFRNTYVLVVFLQGENASTTIELVIVLQQPCCGT